jgi:putative hemolysin
VRFAAGPSDLDAALRLRFRVFNQELGEGLDASWATGRDEDRFDAQCDHLLIEDAATGAVVGTYRMQTWESAGAGHGFYSAGEFDLSTLPPGVLEASVEVGRACIARECRNGQALFSLWRGLAAYVVARSKRYLFGCSSLTSQDPAVGLAAHADMVRAGHAHPDWTALPLPALACEAGTAQAPPAGGVRLPILFETYLRHGAKILGPPALDREFKTIDFLMMLDTGTLPGEVAARFFGPGRRRSR